MIPFQITFKDFAESDAVWMAIQERIERLEKMASRITRCDVVVSCNHRHRHADRLYQVQIHIHLPRKEIVINRHPSQHEAHRDIYLAVRDAFSAAERQLVDKSQVSRHETKNHAPSYELGKIEKIFSNEGYGFLKDESGREIYFAKTSVLVKSFDDLAIGQKVRFVEELGEQGPQVTSLVTL
jgi:ribosomal subunit interface protein